MKRKKKASTETAWMLPTELIIQHATVLRDQLHEAVAAGVAVFDGSAVQAIDTSGVQLLLATQRAVGTGFVLERASASLDAVLHLYRLHDSLTPSTRGAQP